MIDLTTIRRRWVFADGWTPADPALIGSRAIYYGLTTREVRITGVSDSLRYYWSDVEIFPSFQVEPLRDVEESQP